MKTDRVLKGCEVLPPMEETETAASPKKRSRKGRRFRVLNDFVDYTLARVPRTDAAVWLVLYRDARNGLARTAQADLARRAGVCRRTVVRSIKRLRDSGLLELVRRGGLNRGPSVYRVRAVGP